ncbi:hypothetical protein Ndes2526B_g09118 [Nannochloris sp. 'desiccata']
MGSEREDRKSKTEDAASGKEKSTPEMDESAEIISLLDDDNDRPNQDQNDEAAAVESGEVSSPSSREWGDKSSDDDDVPLAARATATGGSSAAGKEQQATKKAQAPVPEKKKLPEQQQEKKKRINDELLDASDSSASNKKPRFAPVRKGGKCGICENCLNPRWKKACIEVRKAQEAAAAAAEGNGSNSAPDVKTVKPAAPAPAAKPVKKPAAVPSASAASVTTAKPLSSEAFANSLGKIMASGGSIVQPSHVAVLIDLMKRANTWGQRQSILSTMVKSIQDVLSEIVQQKGLLILQKWFSEAIEGKRPKSLASLMTTLDAMPISVAALSSPCELGKLVGNLRRAPEELDALKPQAAALVRKWKAIVQRGDATVSVPVERAVTAAATATAKAAAAAAETKAAATKAAANIDAVKQKVKLSSTSLATASTTPSSKLGDDADLFDAADKRRAGAAVPKAKIDTVKAPPKPGTNRKPMLATKTKPGDSSASQSTSSSLLPTVSVSSLSSMGGRGAGAGAGVFGAPAASGGLSFGSHMPVMMTAADRARQRAKEAAARVPPPEPGSRKEKKKKLVWKDVNELESIRWFRKADPPSAAKKDVDDSAPPAFEDVKEPSPPPQFASAAKKEHLSEAHALRAHRQEEDEFRAKCIELLAEMVPDVEWYDPPIIAAATAAAAGTTIATGEQSHEIAAAKARRAGLHPGAPVPTYPLEPSGAERGRSQPLHSIHRIPLSVEEAQLWAAQAQAKQQQQQQQQQQRGLEQQRHALTPQQQGGYYSRSGGGAPPRRYAPPPAPGGVAAQASATASLPDGLSAAIAQLAASGALSAPNANTSAPPPNHQRHQPPQAARQQQQLHQQQQQLHQQQQQRPPPRLQPRGPVLPPGMRPMLGLHRPAQPPPTASTAIEAAPPQPRTQHHIPPPLTNGLGGGGGRSRTPCRFYLSAEGCRAGNNCRFAHLPVDQAAKRPRVDGPTGGGGVPSPAPGFGGLSRF